MSIVAQKITYIHPDNQVLFKGIDLTINKGQKVALVGNNGSGKSTFLRILAGTLQAQEGEIIYPTPPYYVPQHFGQYDNLTVAQALRIDGKLEALRAITEGDASLSNFNTLADDWTIEERSLAALHAWGLEHILLSQPMRTLSGGEKTKVFLSGIEIHQPSILLLDEPTNHLDKRSREKLYDFITSCRITLLVVSHDRTLLNLLASIAELSVGGSPFTGVSYDFYKEQKEQEQASMQEKLEAKEKELRRVRKTAREVAERKQKHESRGEKQSVRKGIPRIHDGRIEGERREKRLQTKRGSRGQDGEPCQRAKANALLPTRPSRHETGFQRIRLTRRQDIGYRQGDQFRLRRGRRSMALPDELPDQEWGTVADTRR